MKKWKFPILIAIVVLTATVLIIFGINNGKTNSVNEPADIGSEQIKNAGSSNNSDHKGSTENSGAKAENSKGNTGTKSETTIGDEKSGDKSLPIIVDDTDSENSQNNTENTESSVVPDKSTPTPTQTEAPNTTPKPTSTPNATAKPTVEPNPTEGNAQPPNNTSDVIELPVIPVS